MSALLPQNVPARCQWASQFCVRPLEVLTVSFTNRRCGRSANVYSPAALCCFCYKICGGSDGACKRGCRAMREAVLLVAASEIGDAEEREALTCSWRR